MNWYKKAKTSYPIWLAEEIKRLTNNYQRDLGIYKDRLPAIEKWVSETNPNLDELSLEEASEKVEYYRPVEGDQYSPEQINRNWNKFISTTQNYNPNAPNFAVDLRLKEKAIKPTPKKRINNAIHELGNHHHEIPLQNLFDICEENGVIVLQEDGTKWSGFLVGGAECGSEKAIEHQKANFQLAVKQEDGEYVPAKNGLTLTWCKRTNGDYEVVSYVF